MRRAALAIALLTGPVLVAAGLSQDNAPSPAPPTASASQESGKDAAPPGQPNSSPVLQVCGPKSPAPCAVVAPHVITAPNPKYSKEARKKKYQGTVILWLVVGEDGLPRDIRVARSLGMGLDEEAIKAVSKWKFKPATLDGKPVAVQINIQVDFRLY